MQPWYRKEVLRLRLMLFHVHAQVHTAFVKNDNEAFRTTLLRLLTCPRTHTLSKSRVHRNKKYDLRLQRTMGKSLRNIGNKQQWDSAYLTTAIWKQMHFIICMTISSIIGYCPYAIWYPSNLDDRWPSMSICLLYRQIPGPYFIFLRKSDFIRIFIHSPTRICISHLNPYLRMIFPINQRFPARSEEGERKNGKRWKGKREGKWTWLFKERGREGGEEIGTRWAKVEGLGMKWTGSEREGKGSTEREGKRSTGKERKGASIFIGVCRSSG